MPGVSWILRRLAFFPLMMGLTGAPVLAQSVHVTVASLGDNTSLIELDTQVRASPKILWGLLTDYDHHAGLLPYMTKSRVISREPAFTVVDQEGTIRILFWSFTMKVRQKVSEEAPKHMHFEAVEGDFTRLGGDWTLGQLVMIPDGASLACRFTVRPKRRVPDWAVRMAARLYLKKMVHALAQAAERNPS